MTRIEAGSLGPAEQANAELAAAETEPRRRRWRRAAPTKSWRRALREDWQLYLLCLLPLVFFFVFRYIPMAGNIIAFRRFVPGGSMFGESWVGFRYIQMFIQDPTFWQVFGNTVILGALTLLFSFPMPIILALALNEVRSTRFKKFVQSASYLPHFLSIVIIAGMIMQIVALNGAVNQLLEAFGGEQINFIQRAEWFRQLYVASDVWQTMGWGTILYLAALTQIDENLYEAARIDGANRWRQTIHVTIPGIAPTIITLLILNIGSFLAVGFEKILLLYSPLTYSTADVISTYLYRVGLVSNNFSYATAIGLFEAIIGLTLVLGANGLSRRIAGTSLW
ncbi:MAG: ABC transporter permease subunit [Propionibacteriaceae bacterium]|nr:ABC transporter permease subunit [Propionibacteriaceae bacterium]